jgi:hypothetical protein
MAYLKLYIWNLLGLLDVAINVLFGGSYQETCSSRLGRHCETCATARVIASIIDACALYLAGEVNHCKSNVLASSYYDNMEVWK